MTEDRQGSYPVYITVATTFFKSHQYCFVFEISDRHTIFFNQFND